MNREKLMRRWLSDKIIRKAADSVYCRLSGFDWQKDFTAKIGIGSVCWHWGGNPTMRSTPCSSLYRWHNPGTGVRIH